jgi:hypothetical protein
MSKIKLSSNASGTGNVTVASPATNSDRTITLPDGDGAMPLMKLETAKTAIGTAVDFTAIPSWVKRITVMFSGVSTNGTSIPQIQIGDVGGVETTGYAATAQFYYLGNGLTALTTGQPIDATGAAGAASLRAGSITITLFGANTWIFSGNIVLEGGIVFSCAGKKTLSDTLTQVRITTVNGTDTFDAGTINIMYEG